MISNEIPSDLSASSASTRLQIRAAGCIGVAAGLANAVADYALRGGPKPVSGAEITSGEMLASVSHASLWFGSLLGAAAMPLWILGLVPVYVGLRPAGRGIATLLVGLFAYGICVSSGYHGAHVLYGSSGALQAALPESSAVARHVGHVMQHHDGVQWLFVVPWIVASLAFVAVVLRGRTAFPRWMAATSPILVPIGVSLAERLPAPFGGYVRPGLGSLLWALFFAMALTTVWRDGRRRGEET